MNDFLPFSNLSLRVKLVLSYLAVALSAIFFLAFAIGFATTQDYRRAQIDHLKQIAENDQAYLIEPAYLINDGRLDEASLAQGMGRGGDPAFLAVALNSPGSSSFFCTHSYFIDDSSNCASSTVQDALKQAIQGGQIVEGNFHIILRVPAQNQAQ